MLSLPPDHPDRASLLCRRRRRPRRACRQVRSSRAALSQRRRCRACGRCFALHDLARRGADEMGAARRVLGVRVLHRGPQPVALQQPAGGAPAGRLARDDSGSRDLRRPRQARAGACRCSARRCLSRQPLRQPCRHRIGGRRRRRRCLHRLPHPRRRLRTLSRPRSLVDRPPGRPRPATVVRDRGLPDAVAAGAAAGARTVAAAGRDRAGTGQQHRWHRPRRRR